MYPPASHECDVLVSVCVEVLATEWVPAERGQLGQGDEAGHASDATAHDLGHF